MMKPYRAIVVLGLATLAVIAGACASKPAPAPEPAAPAATTEAPAAVVSPDAVSGDTGELVLTTPVNAISTGFTPATLSVPAGEEFTLTFNNDDSGIPHNVQIFAGTDMTAKALWAPKDNETVTGPGSVEYQIDALDAGTYTFNCYVHPTMVGTITAA